MKRSICLILICVCLLGLAACVETPKDPVGYSLKSGEVTFTVGDGANEVVAALGEPQSKTESPSCGGGAEPDRTFVYGGFKFDTVNRDGKNVIVKIVITDDSISTPEGISIGDSADDVKAAYGDGFTETASGGLIYSDGKCSLQFGISDGAVSAIHYVEK